MIMNKQNNINSLLDEIDFIQLYEVISFKTDNVQDIIDNPKEYCTNHFIDDYHGFYITPDNLYNIQGKIYAVIW